MTWADKLMLAMFAVSGGTSVARFWMHVSAWVELPPTVDLIGSVGFVVVGIAGGFFFYDRIVSVSR